MIAHQVHEGAIADELRRPVQRLAVASRFGLFDESQQPRIIARRLDIRLLIAGADDDTNLLDTGGGHLLDDDLQRRLLHPAKVHKPLQRQPTLLRPRGRNYSTSNVHRRTSGRGEKKVEE